MVSVYITYRNHPSLKLAKLLAEALTEKHIQVFLSPEDKSGDYKAYYPQIEESDIFICLIAEGTFEPRWIQREVEHAHLLSKPLIPIYHDAYHHDPSIYPEPIRMLLSQEGIRTANVEGQRLNNVLDQLVGRIYAAVGKTPGNQTLIPNQYIFLSYSRRDNTLMNRVRDDFRQNSLGVWVDAEGLEPGTPAWERAISVAVRQSGCIVVLLSPDAEQSVWVGRELAMAETLNKRIFPILVRGSENDAIPFRLMTHQWIDARHNYNDALQKLVASIRKHLNLA